MTTENTEGATPERDAKASPHIGFYSCATVPANFARALEQERDEARQQYDDLATEHVLAVNKLAEARDEALVIGQELADISAHCLGWHIDVAENFKSDHTLALSRKITDTLQRWGKLKEVVK
jgi:hypothetical protein